MLIVQPRNSISVERTLRRARAEEPTFTNVEAVLTGITPDGFHRISRSTTLGEGSDCFNRASHGIRSWRGHDLLGLRIFPVDTSPIKNDTVVVTLGCSYLSIAAPCRIVTVIDESDRCGFIYATLPGHPERGAESFVVTIGNDDIVRFRIDALSAPGDWSTRYAGPLGRAVQSIATSGYLRSMRDYVQSAARHNG